MMTRFISILFIAASLGPLLPACNNSWAAELIEPTRTLNGSGKPDGKLVVFSEPPGMPVSLDGLSIGKTPTSINEVKPGIHHLRIATSETDITIESGQTMEISLYKGEFIKIPEPAKESAHPPAKEVTPTPEPKPSPAQSEEQRQPAMSPEQHRRLFGYY